ncbi:MAG: MinD/ParA family protein [Lachnotalea sp.]
MDQAQQLRNIINLSNQKVNKVARVITITSGKGGVGKSNSAVNLAIQLKRMGKRVIIFDADFGLANIEIMFGAVPKYNLSDLIYRGKNIKEILTLGPEGIGFISGGSGIMENINLNKTQIDILVRNLAELDELADYIIIDTGAGISDAVLEFVLVSKEIILVITPEPTSVTDAYSLLKVLNHNPRFNHKETEIKVMSNKANSYQEGMDSYNKISAVVTKFLKLNITLLGVIPNDDNVSKSIIRQMPVSILYSFSKASYAYENIAKSLENEANTHESRRGIAKMITELLRMKVLG